MSTGPYGEYDAIFTTFGTLLLDITLCKIVASVTRWPYDDGLKDCVIFSKASCMIQSFSVNVQLP